MTSKLKPMDRFGDDVCEGDLITIVYDMEKTCCMDTNREFTGHVVNIDKRPKNCFFGLTMTYPRRVLEDQMNLHTTECLSGYEVLRRAKQGGSSQ